MELRSADAPSLELLTSKPDVVLRELSTPEDDRAYFDAVEESREALDEIEGIGRKYQKLEDVETARLGTNRSAKIRMGVWAKDMFVGSVNATLDPDDGSAEIGYWTRTGYTGNQYATIAAQALAAYVAPHVRAVVAEAAEHNRASRRALENAGFHMATQRTAHRAGYIAYELAQKS